MSTPQVRAKFMCTTETSTKFSSASGPAQRSYLFTPVGADEIPENQRYHKYTPVGKLEIQVDNPAVEFKPGKSYYLDFTEAEK